MPTDNANWKELAAAIVHQAVLDFRHLSQRGVIDSRLKFHPERETYKLASEIPDAPILADWIKSDSFYDLCAFAGVTDRAIRSVR